MALSSLCLTRGGRGCRLEGAAPEAKTSRAETTVSPESRNWARRQRTCRVLPGMCEEAFAPPPILSADRSQLPRWAVEPFLCCRHTRIHTGTHTHPHAHVHTWAVHTSDRVHTPPTRYTRACTTLPAFIEMETSRITATCIEFPCVSTPFMGVTALGRIRDLRCGHVGGRNTRDTGPRLVACGLEHPCGAGVLRSPPLRVTALSPSVTGGETTAARAFRGL